MQMPSNFNEPRIDLKADKPAKQQISLYLPLDILAALKTEALERNLGVSTYIGVILRDYIDGSKQDETVSRF